MITFNQAVLKNIQRDGGIELKKRYILNKVNNPLHKMYLHVQKTAEKEHKKENQSLSPFMSKEKETELGIEDDTLPEVQEELDSKRVARETFKSTRAVQEAFKSTRAVQEAFKSARAVQEAFKSTGAVQEAFKSIRAVQEAFKSTKAVQEAFKSTRAVQEAFNSTRAVQEAFKSTGVVQEAFNSTRAVQEAFKSTGAVQEAFNSTRAVQETFNSTRALREALEHSNWILSQPLLNQMNLRNVSADSSYVFSKIPKEDYEIKKEFGEDEIEYKIESKITHHSVPITELAPTLSIIDIFSDLTVEDVFSFYNFLIKYPMLGLEHEVGKKIFLNIQQTRLKEIVNISVFRARERNHLNRPNPFTQIEMFEAPYGIAGHGRFNVKGQGELYTCDNKEIALKEISSSDKDCRYEIIEWKLIQTVFLLDLTDNHSPLVKYCSFKKQSNNEQEYILPNFIAQCTKFHEITGIKFSSVVEPNVNNYVFYDYEKKWFEFINMDIDVML